MIKKPIDIVKKNIVRFPRRTLLLLSSFMLTGFVLFSSIYMFQSVSNGAELLEGRAGADLIISSGKFNPYSLTGEKDTYFNGKQLLEFLGKNEHITAVAPQLYLETISTVCCGTEGNFPVVAIDPKNDFTLKPFQVLSEPLGDKEVVIGAKAGGDRFIFHAGDEQIQEKVLLFYETYTVKDSLFQTGSGIDDTIYMSLHEAENIITSPFYIKELPENPLSAVFVQVDEGETDTAANEIEEKFPHLHLQFGNELKGNLQQFLQPMKVLSFGVVILVLGMNILQVLTQFIGIVNERKQELGMLRVMGASKWQVGKLMLLEAWLAGAGGGALGIILSFAVFYDQKDLILIVIELPLIFPVWREAILYGGGTAVFLGLWAAVGAGLAIRSLLKSPPFYLVQEGESV
ncbi:ABC transporter permease [Salipaludibacillus aurantiacus]|uniref:ABC-type transport system, involved in lipoprotein release, permease component n=1 Tax=Salipaludibacillus aurantiacus TaxID=1601833 RepID=A0A1H9T418_9BACI|nr:FtsX-like permease family protein [Salipaludibacillus aurantiacus]SER91985.1 ABC-type transport system, involved in lipoprotein release, permease component [Salipaludibacillus aurantiacus]